MPTLLLKNGQLTAPPKFHTDATQLSEEMVSSSKGVLWFPAVGSCVAVIGVTKANVVGCHLTMETEKKGVELICAKMTELCEKNPVTALYFVGNSANWAGMPSKWGGKTAPEFAKAIKKNFDVKGNTYFFDTVTTATKELPHICVRATWTGTAGAVIEVMPQKSAEIPTAEQRKQLKVVPPAKLVTLK
jgi:hypothetical protein